MALATRCPHCGTTFRVANDQLKLRSGLVRCGACKEIFNGIEHLVPVEAPPVIPARKDLSVNRATAVGNRLEPATAPVTTDPGHMPPEKNIERTAEVAEPVTVENNSASFESPSPGSSDAEASVDNNAVVGKPPLSVKQPLDPLQRMTLMDFAHTDAPAGANAEPTSTVESDANDALLDSAIEELTKKPYRRVRSKKFALLRKGVAGKDEEPEFDEPEFVRVERRKLDAGRVRRFALPIFVGLLAVVLLFQLAYVYRHHLSANIPTAKDALVSLCGWIGCTVQLPADIESVVIDSSELQLAPNAKTLFTLSMTLHNKSDAAQAWPSIELTLNDANEQAMVRRVFRPREYLASDSHIEQGIPANSAPSFKLNFELLGPRAAGYKVYLFYH